MKFFLMLIGLVLPILVFSDEKPRMEVPSEGRKLRGNDKYYQKSLPIKALKKVSAAFPEEILAGNNTLDGKAGTVSTLSENVLKKKNLKSKTTYYCFYYYDGYDDYEILFLYLVRLYYSSLISLMLFMVGWVVIA